jgi:TPR repeat protein
MARRPPKTAEAIGMLPKNDERPPFFAFTVSLYQSDLLFRGLVDLAVSGFAILAFTGGMAAVWAPVKSAMNSAIGAIHQPTNDIRTSAPDKFTANAGPGYETMLAIKAPHIPDDMIKLASRPSAGALSEARRHLQAGEPQLALDRLAAADAADPAILFGKAVATLHLGGNGRGLEAQRYLRGATQKAFAPAYTLNGLVLFQLIALHERGDLPASERVSLDSAGRAVEVTPTQLAAEAVLWWQRGAAFHDAEAMRLLGMAEARGLNGKRNLPAAIAYWRDAAARGDALARFELAQLYFEGIGVEPDSEKAYELFRQAADQGITRAAIALGAALVSKGITGDIEATRDALRVLDTVAKKSPVAAERAFAHWVSGVYLAEAAPPSLRDPVRAVDHFRMAVRGGYPTALKSLARAYEIGVGVERDPARAVGYLLQLQASGGKTEAQADLARLSKTLSADELERAKAFRLSDDPVTPAFLRAYEVRQSAPGLNGATTNFGPAPKAPTPSSTQ